MTIAACYLSVEGVVFGADSTATILNRYYNYAQKIFEVGSGRSTLAVVIWGLGGLGELSYRTMIAQFAEDNYRQTSTSVREMADRFAAYFWSKYQTHLDQDLQRFRQLAGQAQRTPDEQSEMDGIEQGLAGGFCLGGNLWHDLTPQAFTISYKPSDAAPTVQPLPMHVPMFWGQPNLLQRLAAGIDAGLFTDILQSGHWTGTPADLLALVQRRQLAVPATLPIREAIDLLHGSLYSTIQAMKFSQLAPACGGPVEIAVISSDRPFRWVRHKRMGAAILFGGSSNA